MTSQAKVNQIASELKKNQVDPTQQTIQGVLDVLASDNRKTVASAVRYYLQQAKPSQTGNAPTGSGDNVGDTLKATTEALAKSIKKKILTDALQIVVSDFSVGDFGGFEIDLGESLTLDVDFTQVLTSSAFTALPATSHGTLQPLLNASTEDSNESV